MDATTKKLVERLEQLEFQRANITHEIGAIMTALTVAGVKPDKGLFITTPDGQEDQYLRKQPFADISLRESCEKVLRDRRGEWLSKSEIEYLIVRGGYQFATSNTKNSVGITLQRLKKEGWCAVDRSRGSRGNRYRWLEESSQAQERKKGAGHAAATKA
jgi:hypothetical protein